MFDKNKKFKKNYVLSTPEYDVLDKVLTRSHIGDTLVLKQKRSGTVNACDYFKDYEEHKKLTLRQGLSLVYEEAIDYKECYHMTEEEIEAFRQLLIKFYIINKNTKLE